MIKDNNTAQSEKEIKQRGGRTGAAAEGSIPKVGVNGGNSVMGRQRQPQANEIDLLELLMEFWRHIIAILVSVLVFGLGAGLFSKYCITPQYSSSSMLYVLSKETTLTSLADLQIGSQLTNDYKVIVSSRPVLQTVIDQLNLDISYTEFKDRLSITNPNNTRILMLTIEDADPVLAKDIVDSVARVSSEYIAETMEMIPPKLIEEGTVAVNKSSPSVSNNALMAALIGGVLMCGIITVRYLLNDAVTTEEDVEKYLGITVLASIPERESASKEKDDKKAPKKSRRKRR